MNIGETIRSIRVERGMSQGDIEKRTGLLRCYLSRVENGHTIPSLDTLAKITSALNVPLGELFAANSEDTTNQPSLETNKAQDRFLGVIRQYSSSLNGSDKKLVLAMVKKMAATGD
jgi:transcriptional regulator with XRE-family HTH domain